MGLFAFIHHGFSTCIDRCCHVIIVDDCFTVHGCCCSYSCKRCARRMSSYKYDKHTLCLHCRDVLCSLDIRCSECGNWSMELMLALAATMVDLQEKGAFDPAPSSPGYYSRLLFTPKVTGGWQPVIDLSCLSRAVAVSHFHMETAQSILQSLRPGDWMVSLDLEDAYLQVPVQPSSRRYLRFCVGDSVLQFRSLCFGLSTAPQAFTRVMAPISSIMH